MTSFNTVGAYQVYQGVIIAPNNVTGGFWYVDVGLGTTQISAKVDTNLFGSCTNAVLTDC